MRGLERSARQESARNAPGELAGGIRKRTNCRRRRERVVEGCCSAAPRRRRRVSRQPTHERAQGACHQNHHQGCRKPEGHQGGCAHAPKFKEGVARRVAMFATTAAGAFARRVVATAGVVIGQAPARQRSTPCRRQTQERSEPQQRRPQLGSTRPRSVCFGAAQRHLRCGVCDRCVPRKSLRQGSCFEGFGGGVCR